MDNTDRQARREAGGRSDAAPRPQAQMKYERPSFAVIGESSRLAQDAYRQGYDAIDWRA